MSVAILVGALAVFFAPADGATYVNVPSLSATVPDMPRIARAPKPPDPVIEPLSGRELAALPTTRPAVAEEYLGRTLPKIAADGSTPFEIYRRQQPVDTDAVRVAVIIGRLGLDPTVIRRLRPLPVEIGVAFYSHGEFLEPMMALAQAQGREAFVKVPLEIDGYPEQQSGPDPLLPTLDEPALDRRWRDHLSATAGYAGIIVEDGPFLRDQAASSWLLQRAAARGLGLVELGSDQLAPVAEGLGLPYGTSAGYADQDLTPREIDLALAQAEAEALSNGLALVLLEPYPLSIEHLRSWVAGLSDKGMVLVPPSAVMEPMTAQVSVDG